MTILVVDDSRAMRMIIRRELRKAGYDDVLEAENGAAALETIKPGALRRMHWHPNADEWQYWIKGKGRMTVFNTGPRAVTIDFQAGDLGVVPKSQGHYIVNTGDEDVQVLAIFKAPEYQEVDLSDWLTHAPPELVAQHLHIDPAVIAKFPKGQAGIQPA